MIWILFVGQERSGQWKQERRLRRKILLGTKFVRHFANVLNEVDFALMSLTKRKDNIGPNTDL